MVVGVGEEIAGVAQQAPAAVVEVEVTRAPSVVVEVDAFKFVSVKPPTSQMPTEPHGKC